jgi:hypothetical protein
VATIIPVSYDGVKTHVFMDDSTRFSGKGYHHSPRHDFLYIYAE